MSAFSGMDGNEHYPSEMYGIQQEPRTNAAVLNYCQVIYKTVQKLEKKFDDIDEKVTKIQRYCARSFWYHPPFGSTFRKCNYLMSKRLKLQKPRRFVHDNSISSPRSYSLTSPVNMREDNKQDMENSETIDYTQTFQYDDTLNTLNTTQTFQYPNTLENAQTFQYPDTIDNTQTFQYPDTIDNTQTFQYPDTIDNTQTFQYNDTLNTLNTTQTFQYPNTLENAQTFQYPDTIDNTQTFQYDDTMDNTQTFQYNNTMDNTQTFQYPDTMGNTQTFQYPHSIDNTQTFQYPDNINNTQTFEYPDTIDNTQTFQYTDSIHNTKDNAVFNSEASQEVVFANSPAERNYKETRSPTYIAQTYQQYYRFKNVPGSSTMTYYSDFENSNMGTITSATSTAREASALTPGEITPLQIPEMRQMALLETQSTPVIDSNTFGSSSEGNNAIVRHLGSPLNWSVNEVITFLNHVDPPLANQLYSTVRQHDIDGKALLLLDNDSMIKYMHMKVGVAMKFGSYIQKLKEGVNFDQ